MDCIAFSIWFRLARKTYPWLPLFTCAARTIASDHPARLYEQIRFWVLLTRVDFANLLAIAIDMAQPEYWLI